MLLLEANCRSSEINKNSPFGTVSLDGPRPSTLFVATKAGKNLTREGDFLVLRPGDDVWDPEATIEVREDPPPLIMPDDDLFMAEKGSEIDLWKTRSGRLGDWHMSLVPRISRMGNQFLTEVLECMTSNERYGLTGLVNETAPESFMMGASAPLEAHDGFRLTIGSHTLMRLTESGLGIDSELTGGKDPVTDGQWQTNNGEFSYSLTGSGVRPVIFKARVVDWVFNIPKRKRDLYLASPLIGQHLFAGHSTYHFYINVGVALPGFNFAAIKTAVSDILTTQKYSEKDIRQVVDPFVSVGLVREPINHGEDGKG